MEKKQYRLPNHSRDELITAIQKYAQSWAAGTETILPSPGRTALCIALDKYEFEYIDEVNKFVTILQETMLIRFTHSTNSIGIQQ